MKSRHIAIFAGLGVLGLAGMVVGVLTDPKQAAFSWLTGFAYWASIAIGALFLLLISYASGASWFTVLRRLNEKVAAVFPMLLVLFVPVLFALKTLYPWVEPSAALPEHARHVLEHKAAYLNVPFFAVRAGIYFFVWILWSELLLRWSVREKGGEGAEGRVTRSRGFAAAGLWAVALTSTFAAFDWYMSLDPMWISTMYGVYWFAGGLVSAIAVVTILGWIGERKGGPLVTELAPNHFYGMGRLLLAFTVFWAYIALFQLLLIWMADLPEEVVWYLTRFQNGWGALGIALIIGHFLIPFFVLLNHGLKFSGRAMATVGGLILVMHYVDVAWVLLPHLHPETPQPSWMDLAAWLAVGGLTVAFGAWRLSRHSLVPEHDPRLAVSLGYNRT